MIKHYIDYIKAFFRNWKEIKEKTNLIIVQDLIHRKIVLQTDDLNKTFDRMKHVIDYEPKLTREEASKMFKCEVK
jgi:translation initiation factor 2 beta subunit (eIF-2beta)/eIF-5